MRAATFGLILLAAAAGGFFSTLAMLGARETQGTFCARDSLIQGYSWQLLEEPAPQNRSVTTARRHPYGTLIRSRFTRMPGSGGATGGAHVRLGNSLTRTFYGRTVTVAIDACTGEQGQVFAAAYSTNSIGNSGWREFKTRDGWNTYCFKYTVPKLTKSTAVDHFVGILSDKTGGEHDLVVGRIAVDAGQVGAPGCPNLYR